ncbi:MAG: T9SS type A sorting domain-containing protein [Bacteroidales bacterium]|jgi:hypothetical protein
MKKIQLLSILFAIVIIPTANAHVSLEYPVGGESFHPGEMVTISWVILIQHNQNNWDLYYSTDGGETWEDLALDLGVAVLEYTWKVPDIITDQARIRIVQDNKDVDYDSSSEDFSIAEDVSTGITPVSPDKTFSGSFVVYPVPADGQVNFSFELPVSGDVSIELYDLTGRNVAIVTDAYFTQGKYTLTENTDYLPTGMYTYKAKAGTEIKSGNFLCR